MKKSFCAFRGPRSRARADAAIAVSVQLDGEALSSRLSDLAANLGLRIVRLLVIGIGLLIALEIK